MKENNAIFSCQLLLLSCGRFERSGVQASCRAPNSIYQTRWPSHRCSGAVGVFRSRWRCVSVVTQRKVWTPLSKRSSKISFLKQAGWSRRPLLVICTVVNNDFFFLIEDPCPILICSRDQKLTNVFRCLRVSTLTGCPLRSNKTNFQRADASFFSIRRVHHEEIGWERRRLLSSRSRFSQSAKA